MLSLLKIIYHFMWVLNVSLMSQSLQCICIFHIWKIDILSVIQQLTIWIKFGWFTSKLVDYGRTWQLRPKLIFLQPCFLLLLLLQTLQSVKIGDKLVNILVYERKMSLMYSVMSPSFRELSYQYQLYQLIKSRTTFHWKNKL